MKWFKHDSNAHIDAKLKKVKHKYGIVGYGLYWYCIELIAMGVDRNNISFELEEDAETIALEWNLDQLKVQEMMEYMVRLNLFENQNGQITCLKLAKRLDDTNSKNPEVKRVLDLLASSSQEKVIPNDSDLLGETPNDSAQIRLDEIRLEKDKQYMSSPDGDGRAEDDVSKKNKKQLVPYQKIVDLYHDELPTLSRVAKVSEARKAQIRARWNNDLPTLDDWQEYFRAVRASDFLMGKSAPTADRKKPFIADLEWLIKESNMIKIVEGKYHG